METLQLNELVEAISAQRNAAPGIFPSSPRKVLQARDQLALSDGSERGLVFLWGMIEASLYRYIPDWDSLHD